MTPEQFLAAMRSIERSADLAELTWDGFSSAATYEVTLRSNRSVPMEGRTAEEAVQQVVDQIRALAKELEEIGV